MIANLDTVAPDVAAVAAATAAAAEEEEKSPMTDEDKTRKAFPSFVSFAEDLQQKVPNHKFMLALEELKNVTEATDERSLWDYFTKHNLHDLKAIQGFMNAHQIITASITDFLSYAEFLENWYNSPENGRTMADDVDKTLLKELLLDTEFRSCDYKVLEYLETHVRTGVQRFQMAKNTRDAVAAQTYKGPFSAVCQSSGMGKTRLSLQLATRDHMHVIYMCCRTENSGYPPRTHTIASYIETRGAEATFWPVLFSVIMDEYCRRRLKVEDSRVRCEWLKRIVQNPDYEDFWKSVVKKCDARRSSPDASEQAVEALMKFGSKDYLIFVFDGASVLAEEKEVRWQATPTGGTPTTVSILNRIRKALYDVGGMCNIFGLFVDTNSQICHLPPSDSRRRLAPSARKGDVTKSPLLVWPPFCVLPFCNPGQTDHMPSDIMQYFPLGTDAHVGVRVSFCPMTLALLSRPLFAMDAFRQFQSPRTSHASTSELSRLVALAKEKLLGRHEWDDILRSDRSPFEAEVARLAVLGCRFLLSSTSTLHQQLLVRQHMATCFGISDDGKDLIVGYQSEPLLAEAAAQIMRTEGAFKVLLEALCGLAARGSLVLPSGKGEIGEVVVCLALSRAFDKASDRLRCEQEASRGTAPTTSRGSAPRTAKPSPISSHSILCRPIPLVDVLVELYGRSKKARIVELLANSALGRGVVMFNHFVKGGPEPIRNVASYTALLKRGAAVLCKNGEAAKDTIIPVALPKSPNGVIDLWNRDSYVLTTWEVQVKHWQAAFNFNTLVSQMVATKTVDAVDSGFHDCVRGRSAQQQEERDTASTAASTTVYQVPILYSAFNTNANRASGVASAAIGSTLTFDRHWAMSSGATGSSSQAADAAMLTEVHPEDVDKPQSAPLEGERQMRKHKAARGVAPSGQNLPDQPLAKKQKQSKHDVPVVASSTTLQTETDKTTMEVVGTHLCGVANFAVFDAAEKRLIQRLLRASDDTMTLLLEYHTNVQGVTLDVARDRVRCLRPERG